MFIKLRALQAIQEIAPVTAICVVAIAAILILLLCYLSRLLAIRLQGITEQGLPPSTLRQQEQHRQRLLSEIRRELEAQGVASDLPAYTWNGELTVGGQSIKLTTTQLMLKAFQHPRIAGQLLIVGEAGAGKTTLLLDFARILLTTTGAAHAPLPVVLNLSRWTESYISFEQWLLTELKAKYGLRTDIGQYWLEQQQILPLLDGLEELPSEALQDKCVEAIRQFQQTFQPPGLVLCCQMAPQRAAQLDLTGIITLHPLTRSQVQDYLKTNAQPPLQQLVQQYPHLLPLMQSPLMLNVLSHTPLDPTSINFFAVTHNRDVLALHVEKMLGRDNPHAPLPHAPRSTQTRSTQTLHWLNWLAHQMQKRGQNEFLIERIQPSWLPSRSQRRWHRIIVVLLAAAAVGAIAAWTDRISELGITSPVFWGVIAAAIAAFPDQINLVETLSWSRRQARQGLLQGLLRGVTGSLIFSVLLLTICAMIYLLDPLLLKNIRETLIAGGILAAIVILLSGLMGALLTGLSGPVIERRSFPNQGIWRSARNTLIFALIGFVMGTLVTGVFSGMIDLFFNLISPIIPVPLMFRILYYPPVMIKTGIMISVMSGLTAGLAALQHFVLRGLLWRNGSIPWNYARFLKQVTQHKLMQQVGGRYCFTHALLRDYLAQSYSASPVPSVSAPSAPSTPSAPSVSSTSSASAAASMSSSSSRRSGVRAVGSKTTL